jgi:hypothetical protein
MGAIINSLLREVAENMINVSLGEAIFSYFPALAALHLCEPPGMVWFKHATE